MPDGSPVAARISAGTTATPPRDTSRDGLRNRIEFTALTRLRPLWEFINGKPALARLCNTAIVNNAVLKAPVRPLALSTAAPYTSWTSLNDRSWFARYLPPVGRLDQPPLDDVTALFKVGAAGPRVSKRSTLLFPSFAQWFTDGFLMTDNDDRRRTRTNHQIDLSQLYGLKADVTRALRLGSNRPDQKGRLKSVTVSGEEWAPRLYDSTGARHAEFSALPEPLRMPPDWPVEKKAGMFAFGGERANATSFTAMINILFLREHNRLCGMLERDNPGWDDDRVFETARNINIVQLINIVVEEYINHISPYWFRLLGNPSACYKAVWNRENWIPVEFNLLYRWHSLVPEQVVWDDRPMPILELRIDNRPLLRSGLGGAFENASRSRAWQIGLFNTPDFLIAAERASVAQGRENQLASYNDYRQAMRYPRITRFEQINSDPDIVSALRQVYRTVDRIEFFVGLFAEETQGRSAVPGLIGRMVAADAFSHALTNPLLSPHVFNDATFTRRGMHCLRTTSTLKHLLDRNLQPGRQFMASMEQA